MIDISSRAEQLLTSMGVPWNGWQYEVEDFIEMNGELEANGVPIFASFEDYLEARADYRRKAA